MSNYFMLCRVVPARLFLSSRCTQLRERRFHMATEVSRPTNCIVCPGHTRPIPDLSFSKPTADGTFLVSACLDGKPIIRAADSGDWIGTFDGHRGAVWKVRLNASAEKAITASADFSVKLWDAVSGTDLHTFQHKHIVKTADFAHSAPIAVTGGHEKVLRLFDLNNLSADPIMLNGHTKPIAHAMFSHDDNLIYTAGEEKNVRIWDRRSLAEVAQLPTNADVKSIEMSPCGTLLTVASGHDVLFFSLESNTLVHAHKLKLPVKCAALHPSRSHFAVGLEEDLWVRLYDYKTGAEFDCQRGHHGPVNCVSFVPGSNTYATGSVDGTIRLWTPLNDETLPPLAL